VGVSSEVGNWPLPPSAWSVAVQLQNSVYDYAKLVHSGYENFPGPVTVESLTRRQRSDMTRAELKATNRYRSMVNQDLQRVSTYLRRVYPSEFGSTFELSATERLF
jgi:hypothetical protein